MNGARTLLIVVAAFVAFSALQASAAEAPLCTSEFLSPKCEDLTNQPLDLRRNAKEADGVIFNYFRALNPKFSDEVRNFGAKTTSKQHERTLEIAEEIRKSALSFVTKDRPATQISADNRAFAERLITVRFRIRENFSPECYAVGDPGVPNANYNPIEHTITICASSVRVTSQWIATTIAHELGHVISTCSMASPLLKFKEATETIDRCLFDKDTASERSDEDKEIWGSRSVGYESESRTYTVNHTPESMSEFIRCDGVETLPGSQVQNPAAYRNFNRCIETQNAADYENWIAKSTLDLDVMPKTLPPQWLPLIERAKAETPLRCFRKNEEQFADSFGGLVYSAWATKKKMSGAKFKLALHDFALINCRERLTGEILMNRIIYPVVSKRIETIVHNKNAAKLLQCTLPTTSACRLDETSFETPLAAPPPPKSSPTGAVK